MNSLRDSEKRVCKTIFNIVAKDANKTELRKLKNKAEKHLEYSKQQVEFSELAFRTYANELHRRSKK